MATKSLWSPLLFGLLLVCCLANTIRAVQITEDGEENEQPEAGEKMVKAEEDPDVFVAHQVKEFVQKLDELNAQNPVEKKHSTWHPTQADYDQLLRTFFQRNVYFLQALGALAKAMIPHHGRYANLAIFDEQFYAKCRNSLKSMKWAMHASKTNKIIPAHFDESAKFLEEINLSDSSALSTTDGENHETGKAILQMRTKMNKFLQKFAREAQMARMFLELGERFFDFAISREHYLRAISHLDAPLWRQHNQLRELSQQLCGLLRSIVYTMLLNSVEHHVAIGELPAQKKTLGKVWRLGEHNVPDKFNQVLALVPYAKHEQIVAEIKEKLAMPEEWKKAEAKTMDKPKETIYRLEAQIRRYTAQALVTYYKFLQQFPNCYDSIKDGGQKKSTAVNGAAGQNKATATAVALAHDESMSMTKKGEHLSPTTNDGKNEEAEMMEKKEKDDI